MGIRLTESRIPADFRPQDLGDAVEVADGTGQVKYALVSYLTSPIAKGSTIDYVVFVLGEDLADAGDFAYRWTLCPAPSGETEQKMTAEGIYRLNADRIGQLTVRVEVLKGTTVVAELSLIQRVTEPEPGLEALFAGTGMLEHLNVDAFVGSLGGNPRASRELINNFRRYVLAATDPPVPFAGVDLPARFLAAIVYAEILRVAQAGVTGREAELEAAAAELNGDWSLARGIAGMQNALGVCQIKPQTLAMIIERSPGISYTPWTDLPSDPDRRPAAQKTILKNLNGLPDAEIVKVDLFNLLRFPKSNILMCARLLRRLATRDRRWPNATRAQLIQDNSALGIVATEYNIGGTESLLAPEQGPPAPMDAKANAYGRRIVQSVMILPPIVLYFADSTSKGASAYGGHALQRNDNDEVPRWGGSLVVAPLPMGDVPHVKALQQDLADLGFKIVGGDSGIFQPQTEWAVREFQIYAKMPNVAAETGTGTRYVSRLTQASNVLPYAGPVSGVVNAATRVALQYWKASRWRCPVVLEASTKRGASFFPIVNKDNLWMPHDFSVSSTSKYVRARDFTSYYETPQEFTQDLTDPDDLTIVGRYYDDQWGGPTSLHHHAWGGYAGTEVTPFSLLGLSEKALGGDWTMDGIARRSTFKVIRVVAEIENLAYFDAINCWDTAYLSLGNCHWTIGRPGVNPTTGIEPDVEREGELIGFLAYLEQYEPESFHKALGFFGVRVDKAWIDEDFKLTGKRLFKKTQRKYSGWLTLEQEDGTYKTVDQEPYKTTKDGAHEDDQSGLYYFKTWHWFYRFQMAARTVLPFRQRMWDFARIRIRDVLTVPWGVPSKANQRVTANGFFTDRNGMERQVEIGDVFTSEKAVGLLLRWHINRPAQVVAYNSAAGVNMPGAKLLQAFAAARSQPETNFDRTPTEWENKEEEAVIKGILAKAINPDDLKRSMNFVDKFPPGEASEEYGWERDQRGYQLNLEQLAAAPGETKELKEQHRSFKFFAENLPDAPLSRGVDYYTWG